MKEIIMIVFPVVLMLVLGKFCKLIGIIDSEGSRGIKNVLTQLVLPVAIFHAIATGSYSINTAFMFAGMFVILGITFVVGFLCRPLVKGKYQKYLPFITSVYEGGMIAYPLYANLCGAENLSNMALLDIVNCLFCFSIYMGFYRLRKTERRLKYLL